MLKRVPMAYVSFSPSWTLSCAPLRRERLLPTDAERSRRSSSMFNSKNIPTLSAIFVRSHRGPAPAAAGLKRYWGTAMREMNLSKMIEKKVAEAMETCNGEEGMRSDGCRVAWDEVEEVSSALADLRRRLADSAVDPLEPFCLQNPEAEECRIYEY